MKLIKMLEEKMNEASENMEFEAAIEYRDLTAEYTATENF